MIQLQKSQIKTILIIIGSLAVVGGISFGTFALLRQLKPAALSTLTKESQSNTPAAQPQATGPDADRQRAEQFLKDGKLTEAQTAYQAALTGYTSAGETAAATDVKTQLAMIDAMLKSQSTAKPQTYQPHQSGTTK